MSKRLTAAAVAALLLAAMVVAAVAARRPGPGPKPPPAGPVGAEEKARWLAAETPAQKQLRAELAALQDARILFDSNHQSADGTYALFSTDLAGDDVRRLGEKPAGTNDFYPHLSPDGRRLAFYRTEPGAAEWLKDLPHDPAFKLDDRRITPGQAGSFIWVMGADGSGARRLAHGSHPHWSPDGQALAYCFRVPPREYREALFNLEANAEKVLVHPGLGKGGITPCFSRDGRWLIAWQHPTVIARLNAAGTDLDPEPRIISSAAAEGCNGEVSPDGRWLAWTVDTYRLHGSWLRYARFDPASGGISDDRDLDLGWPKKSINYFPEFSPCGRYLVYAHAEMREEIKSWLITDRQDLYVSRFPADGVAVRVTWTNAVGQHPCWGK